jgi:hypothetical protein
MAENKQLWITQAIRPVTRNLFMTLQRVLHVQLYATSLHAHKINPINSADMGLYVYSFSEDSSSYQLWLTVSGATIASPHFAPVWQP